MKDVTFRTSRRYRRFWLTVAACLAFLLAACDNWNTEKFFKTATVQEVVEYLQAGADPNVRDKTGRTPLHQAAWNNDNPAIIDALIDAGADPKARTKAGGTPYMRRPGTTTILLSLTHLLTPGPTPIHRPYTA